MPPLNQLESFVRSAESGSFSGAARHLGLTPAAVSKNVAKLEVSLGVRLFQRSTRKLKLTESGARLFHQIGGLLTMLGNAVDSTAHSDRRPAGTLKVSMSPAFGRGYVLPMLTDFLARYPAVLIDWHLDNRQVDLIGEGFDAAIGGGFDPPPGVVARDLAQTHIVAVAAPGYMAGRQAPRHPSDLATFDGIVRRSSQTGRVQALRLRNSEGDEAEAKVRPRLIFNEYAAMIDAATMGLGITTLPMAYALPGIQSGELVRVLPGWYAEAPPVYLYYPSKKLLPAKTRVFVDFVMDRFQSQQFASRMQSS